jgi:hypothetical protein
MVISGSLTEKLKILIEQFENNEFQGLGVGAYVAPWRSTCLVFVRPRV